MELFRARHYSHFVVDNAHFISFVAKMMMNFSQCFIRYRHR